MDDEADVKKIVEILNDTNEENFEILPYEERFINFEEVDDIFVEEATSIQEYDPLSTTENPLESRPTDSVSILTSNEKAIVDYCQDADLKQLLILNRTKNTQLIQLYKKIKDLLMECKLHILEENKLIKLDKETPKYQRYASTGAWRLGAPYFKDRDLFGCPQNADTIRKKENRELSTYDLTPTIRWSQSECARLLSVVKLNYSLNRQTDIRRKLMALNKSLESEKVKDAKFKELMATLKELQDNDYTEVPPLHSNVNINWNRISDHFLRNKHTDTECRAFWHLYIHPSINKSPWTPDENTKLKQLVRKYRKQNWPSIVQELGTNRTPFTACVNYFSHLHNKFKKGEFTYAEDKKLVDLVRDYKMGSYIPWIKISEHFSNRTRHQLHHRYMSYLSQDDRKRGRFTDAEDLVLTICVDKFGKKFRKCREFLPHRQQVQLKSRYNTNLQHFLKKGSWSLQEDQQIMKYVEKNGSKKWGPISKELGRSRGQVRQRYHVIYYHLRKFGGDIENVPRRKHYYNEEEEKFFELRSIADEFKDKPVPTLQEADRLLRGRNILTNLSSSCDEDDDNDDNHEDIKIVEESTIKDMIDIVINKTESETEEEIIKEESSDDDEKIDHKNIDHWLTEHFSQTRLTKQKKVITSKHIIEAVDTVEKVLSALHADLEIPEDFDTITGLDNIDVAILMHVATRLKSKKKKKKQERPIKMIPPNLYTLSGLDGLLKKCSKNKQPHKSVIEYSQRHGNLHCPIKRVVESELLLLDDPERRVIEKDRNLFFQRFHALFKWSALMSCESPTDELVNVTENLNNTPIAVVKTYSKAHPILEEVNEVVPSLDEYAAKQIEVEKTYGRGSREIPQSCPAKRVKLNEGPLANSSVLKLTPVTNKSVIENLLNDPGKKLFTFEKVKSDGRFRAVIKEVKFPVVKCEPGGSCSENFGGVGQSSPSTSKIYPVTITLHDLSSDEDDD